jgi:hypothetical protein
MSCFFSRVEGMCHLLPVVVVAWLDLPRDAGGDLRAGYSVSLCFGLWETGVQWLTREGKSLLGKDVDDDQ